MPVGETEPVLTDRALNRATLARQLLLQRDPMSPIDAVAHLVGLQAQVPANPYVALWSRLDHLDPADLERALLERAVVRIVLMRGTIHLVTADDALALRPLFQPVLDAELDRHPDHAPHLRDVDLTAVLAFVRPLVAQAPRTQAQLRAALAAEYPDLDAAALAYACRNHLAMVQVPPRGLWHRSGQVTSTTVDAWLGRSVTTSPSLDDAVLRYFAAFGPATVADVAAWTRLTGLREVVDRLRPALRPFRDVRGRELLDLPDAPRPDPDTPAPTRFLTEYDNVLLSHADRARFHHDDERRRQWQAPLVRGSVLHDGLLTATWHVDGDHRLVVHHGTGLTKRAKASIASEGRRLLRFHEGDRASGDVRFVDGS
jgi:hypothetical protein